MMNLTKEQIEQLQAAMKKHIDEEAKKCVSELDKILDIVVAKLVTEGWTLPAELPITAVYALGNTDKLDDVNGFMEQLYAYDDYRNMKTMIKGIQESKIKEGLKKLINECWNAFNSKMYAICATSLLSVIEGILSEFSDDKQDIRMMKVCQKQVDSFPNDGSTIMKHVWISYNQFIRNLYKKSDFTDNEPDAINRHWLLHGRSDFEVEEIECMKLFNAIHSLCMIINKESN
jgi:hypothetical protein|nr:MAG TPA: hypothetical protein [Caudoviricetes sp.]DAY69660.1 MAG TPA: hypothetical protein [Caudoviricetes sp.]